ncbi:alpha/beta hydrolase family protein [Aurantiacibacter sp. MUD61]|uniref:alpha/beta hydrolase family protein n=1 Tax=Aurantiacibacter sp. MUD61 TaxID=3009083 RepID=UPI0022F11023|nr:alpha/beta hydrolase [Aurantiacibacter sp. MUD61]
MASLLGGCQADEIEPSLVDGTQRAPMTSGDCMVGVYPSGDGELIIVTEGSEGFNYATSAGEIGQIADATAPARCAGPTLVNTDGIVLPRLQTTVTDTRFQSGDIELAGRLIQPPGAGPDTPVIVFAHGSEEEGWIGRARDPYQMVGRGITVFVYDKRGTGASGGTYSQNFPDLADDLVAASAEARRLLVDRHGRFGLVGLSQGGWIAPLASERADADFIGIGYGLVVDIREEDASQVELELREGGYSEEVPLGRELTDITARMVVSNYQDGLEEFAAFRDRYAGEPWLANLRGGYSGVLLNIPIAQLRDEGVPMFDRLNIDWSLDPVEVLRDVQTPQLWALAGADREAPIDTTLERLRGLRAEGSDITIYVFPETDHGMWEFAQADDGSREITRVTDGFYDLMADWARGDVTGTYGRATQR